MNRISVEDAKARHWDVVIAGSSFASMFFLFGLPPDLSVLVVEKGDVRGHAQLRDTFGQDYESFQSNSSKRWTARTVFGGNSNCWWGQTPRFHPSDFRTRSLFGRAEDWLVGYDELEPFYNEVETVMEVSGGGNDHILPRSQPFPFPPHTQSRSDVVLQNDNTLWVAAPSARSNGGSRGLCCANGICHACPLDSKFTILNGLEHFDRDNVFLLESHEVREIRVEAGTARSVNVLGLGKEAEIRSDLVALGTNAIFNPAILLRSGFTAPSLGRYLHEQIGTFAQIDMPIKSFFGGTSITAHGYHFYHGFDRTDRAAVLVENYNAPAATRPEKNRWTERLTLKLIAEDLPHPENRVRLENDNVVVDWHGHSEYANKGLEFALENLDKLIPARIEGFRTLGIEDTEAHIIGTTRMGETLADGVVDRHLRTHEAANVLCLGSGVFPSCSPANPTLTLSALSVMAARALQ